MNNVAILPLKDQAAAALRAEICAGRLADGTQLRQEEIAARLGVSRIPVREALLQLQSEGLVVRLPNRHMQVVGITAARLRQNFSALAALEGELSVLAAPALRGQALPEQDAALHDAVAAALSNPTLYQLFAAQRRALFDAVLSACPPQDDVLAALNEPVRAALISGQDARPALRCYYQTLADRAVQALGL